MPADTSAVRLSSDLPVSDDGTCGAYTGQEYLSSLNDGREVWIYGERVKDVANHPAFRNSARMMARVYDALHDPATREIMTVPIEGNPAFRTHRFFQPPRNVEDVRR